MKKIKNNLLGFIIGGIVFGGISYTIASQILATQVSYANENSPSNVTSVDAALTELYGLAEECQNSSSSGSTIEYKGSAAEAIYLDPTGTKNDCSSSNFTSTTETKEGCMRFYVYAEDGEYKYAILDHNTTAIAMDGFYSAQAQVKQDTSTWNPNYQARNISAYELYKISEDTNNVLDWQVKDGSKQFFFSGSNITAGQGYGWLFDRTYDCEMYGCTTNDATYYNGRQIFGYWTGDNATTNSAWVVYTPGMVKLTSLKNNSYYGVRPVIKIAK